MNYQEGHKTLKNIEELVISMSHAKNEPEFWDIECDIGSNFNTYFKDHNPNEIQKVNQQNRKRKQTRKNLF